MRRTTIEVDEELLAGAQAALGTTGLRDTVEAAFTEAVRRNRRDRLASRLEGGVGIDLSPEVLAEARPAR